MSAAISCFKRDGSQFLLPTLFVHSNFSVVALLFFCHGRFFGSLFLRWVSLFFLVFFVIIGFFIFLFFIFSLFSSPFHVLPVFFVFSQVSGVFCVFVVFSCFSLSFLLLAITPQPGSW